MVSLESGKGRGTDVTGGGITLNVADMLGVDALDAEANGVKGAGQGNSSLVLAGGRGARSEKQHSGLKDIWTG